jgi:excisionase family DNA binding protein
MNDTPLALRVKDFCSRIGISASTFWKYVAAGKIKVFRLGGRTLIPFEEVERIKKEGVQ